MPPTDPESILTSISQSTGVNRAIAIEWLRQANNRGDKELEGLGVSKEEIDSFIQEQYGFEKSTLPQFGLGLAKPIAEYGGGLLETLAGTVSPELGKRIGEETYGRVEEAQGQFPEAPVASTVGEFAGFPIPGAMAYKGAEKALGPVLSRAFGISTPFGKASLNTARKVVQGEGVAEDVMPAVLKAGSRAETTMPVVAGAVSGAGMEAVAPGRSAEDIVMGGLFGGGFGIADSVMRSASNKRLGNLMGHPEVANGVKYVARMQHRTPDEIIAGIQTFGELDKVLRSMPEAPQLDVVKIMTPDEAGMLAREGAGGGVVDVGVGPNIPKVTPEETESVLESLGVVRKKRAARKAPKAVKEPNPLVVEENPAVSAETPSHDLRLSDLFKRSGKKSSKRNLPTEAVSEDLRSLLAQAETPDVPEDILGGMQRTATRVKAIEAIGERAKREGVRDIPKKVIPGPRKAGRLIPMVARGEMDEADLLLYRLEQEFRAPKEGVPVSKEKALIALHLRKDLGYSAPFAPRQQGQPIIVPGRRFSRKGSPDLFYGEVPSPEYGDKLVIRRLAFKNPRYVVNQKGLPWGDLVDPTRQAEVMQALREAKAGKISDIVSNPRLYQMFDQLDAEAISKAVNEGHDGLVKLLDKSNTPYEYIDLSKVGADRTPLQTSTMEEVLARVRRYDEAMTTLSKENDTILNGLKGDLKARIDDIKKRCK